ncbi:hypothetical protein [Aquimarina macrocephali]|uniref:hypothetical protein n=1 Tax=Aquimarina macrocephali TaxID=666563 RepID=UPI0012680F68|nr:hypothetical protein [Aquimarina macrocephali]
MLTTDFNKMTDEEKQIVITRLAIRTDTDTATLKEVLSRMNPTLNIEDNRVLISRHTLERLHKKLREYNINKP